MARKSFSVLFFIKKAKLLKNGEAPVCMRIIVNGCMVDISIQKKLSRKPMESKQKRIQKEKTVCRWN